MPHPPKSLGLRNSGHLGEGATADITVYNDLPNREKMFEKPTHVFKDGEHIVTNGKLLRLLMARHIPLSQVTTAQLNVR